jgi:hypothetical protein
MGAKENVVVYRDRTEKDVLVAAPSRIGGSPLALLAHSSPVSFTASLTGYFASTAILRSDLPLSIRLVLVVAILSGVGLFGLRTVWERRQTRRSFEQTPEGRPSEVLDGTRIRFVGIAQPRASTFRTVIGRQALVARYIGTRGRWDGLRWLQRPRCELHGVDFDVKLRSGEIVGIKANDLVLLPHPPRVPRQLIPVPGGQTGGEAVGRSWIYSEEVIASGDELEIAGTIRLVLDPGGYAASDRQPRMVPILTADGSGPISVSVRKTGAPR